MKKDLIFASLLSTFTFLLGVFLGYFLIGLELKNLQTKYEDLKVMVESAYYYLEETQPYCDFSDLDILGGKLDDLGYQIEILENAENPFKDYSKIKLLKTYYFNLEYLHYLLAKRMMENCNITFNIIIFFYEPDSKCPKCKKQGYQLIHLKKKYPKKILIYSYDLDYPNYFIYYYKSKYNIKEAPAIIIINKNGTKILKGYYSWEEIENYLTL